MTNSVSEESLKLISDALKKIELDGPWNPLELPIEELTNSSVIIADKAILKANESTRKFPMIVNNDNKLICPHCRNESEPIKTSEFKRGVYECSHCELEYHAKAKVVLAYETSKLKTKR